MKIILTLSFLILLPLNTVPSPAWGAGQNPENQFSQVTGRVKVLSAGGTTRRVAKGDKAYAGETIEVGSKAGANVDLFDGSSLKLSANTKLTLSSLTKPAEGGKMISLKLALGKVFAQVSKLLTAKSSFEIEAGGVVCGVRGTAFSMDFDPKTKYLDLNVFEGKVGATNGGSTLFYTAGQQGTFLNGHPTGGTTGGTSNGSKTGGKGGTSSGGSNGNGNGSGGNSDASNGNNNSSGGNNNASGGTSNNTEGSASNGNANGTGGTNPGDYPDNPNPKNENLGNVCLGDINTQFTGGILINGDNSLSSAQRNLTIHLVVP